MDNELDFFSKLDIFRYDYTENIGSINGYIVGKSITDNKERFVSSMAINPNYVSDDFLIYNSGSIDSKTIIMDIKLLTDNVIKAIINAYVHKVILGIRILPDGVVLTKDLFDKLNVPALNGLLVAVDNVDDNITTRGNLDLRVQNNICKYEHISYKVGNKNSGYNFIDHYNTHINRLLTDEEIKILVYSIKSKKCDQIYLDYYDPSYYKKFLSTLKKYGCPSNVSIILLGNPLYDATNCYEGFKDIIDNNIIINYNTCNDLNECFSREPYTEGVKYYSDIEASGKTDSENYFEMLKTIDNVVKHMEDMKYSSLEKHAYLEDYFKDNFIYDPDYQYTDHDYNAHLDKIYKKDRMVCEGFSNLYSAILRRSGELCFTYGTDDHQKNISRIRDKKYGIDALVLIDTTNDLGSKEYGNEFSLFLVPINNDIYAQNPEVISIPNALIMDSKEYFENIKDSNPVYATDPIGYAIRMLQLMGLTHGDRIFNSYEEEIEYYKAALANTTLLDEISYEKIVNAIMEVRRKEGKYKNNDEEWVDFNLTTLNIQDRGNDHYLSPAIKMLYTGMTKEVHLFDVNKSIEHNSRFFEAISQNDMYHRPREKDTIETQEDYDKYLERFYREMFHPEIETVEEEVREFVIDDVKVDEIVLYRDLNDSGRVFAEEKVFTRFNLKLPKKVITYGDKELYELLINDAIDILDNANNNITPYIVNYSYIDSKEIKDKNESKIKGTLIVFRDAKRPNMLYIRKIDYDKYGFDFDVEEVRISGLDCCSIDQGDLSYIIGLANNNDLFDIEYNDVDININNMEPVYKDMPDQVVNIYKNSEDGKLYITKEIFEKLHFNTNVVEVVINGMSLYEIDENNYAYIIISASNKYNPYRIIVNNVRINTNESMDDREYIPGTNYLKPRVRGPYETDEEYVSYLEEYYNNIFGNKNDIKVR